VRTELFDYTLPDAAIAAFPPSERDGARLCKLTRSGPEEGWVRDLPALVLPGDLLVVNETKVRRARAYVRRPKVGASGGGRVEVLFLNSLSASKWEALARAGGRIRPGDRLEWPEAELEFTVLESQAPGTLVLEASGNVERALEEFGEMPLPPYMKRDALPEDTQRYQTVFARELGSAAAPTAGLHLTDALLDRIRGAGASVASVVLHVGLGTFRPVSADDLDEHDMHEEGYTVEPDLVEKVRATKAAGGRVIAIGTTVVRALESAALAGGLRAGAGTTRLLIQPGYRFQVVDALFTNFHQPRSTLLALVSAFVGRTRLLESYAWALARNYRFLSYGDAMWIPERFEP
jgi:S-adenosylmethionine:tRNA ribosyltransferase-isomerase